MLRLLSGRHPAGLAAAGALALPPTYVFEGLRAIVLEGNFVASFMLKAFALNMIYFALGFAAFASSCRVPAGTERWCRWANEVAEL